MNVGSLYSGVGGFDIAAERAGMTVLWQSETDTHASRVLNHHWPNLNLGDIHDIRLRRNESSIEQRDVSVVANRERLGRFHSEDGGTGDRRTASAVDVLVGGFPCQDYSVAGNRKGLAGDRGALWWQFHRLIGEGRPEWVVGENVLGLLSSRDGADFATIVDSLVEYGYGVVWAVLDAQWFGVAQRRRRVFIVAHSGGEPRPEVLALAEGMFGHPEPSRETGQGIATSLETRPTPDRLRAEQGHIVFRQQRTTDYVEDQIASTVAARDYKSATDLVAFAWQAGGGKDSSGAFSEDGATPTLPANQTLAIAFAQNQRDEVRDLGDTAGALAAQPGMKQQTYIAQQTVRRLTPLECQRLQGFPDDWYDGIDMSDAQKYRQLGNAVAVPVAEWIMRNIIDTDTKQSV